MGTSLRRIRALAAALVSGSILAGCHGSSGVAQSPGTPGNQPGVQVGQPGGEVAAVKETLRQMSTAKTLGEIGPYLSNRSAAALGMVLLIPVGLIVAFADMGDQFAKMAPSGGSKPAAPSQDKKLQDIKALKTDFESVMKKYGVDEKKGGGEDQTKKVESRGREFFADMAGLIDKLGKTTGDKSSSMDMKPDKLVKDIDKMEYKVVSPTEVAIVDKDKPDQKAKAVVEDGKWRIDFGGMEDLGKMMNGGKGGANQFGGAGGANPFGGSGGANPLGGGNGPGSTPGKKTP